MRVVELKNIMCKETPLHYIKEFSATAVLETSTGTKNAPLSFTVERKPLGPPDISIRFLEEQEWPLVPLIQSVKGLIIGLDKQGGLP